MQAEIYECNGLVDGESKVYVVDADYLNSRRLHTESDVAAVMTGGTFRDPYRELSSGSVSVVVRNNRAACPMYSKTDGRCMLYDATSVADGLVYVHPCKAAASQDPVKAFFRLATLHHTRSTMLV